MKNTVAQIALEALKLLDPTLGFMDWEGCKGDEIGTQLRALVASLEQEIAQPVEPVDCQFQGQDGRWHSFLNDEHKANTIADGTWPIRTLYTSPQEAAAAAPVNAELLAGLQWALSEICTEPYEWCSEEQSDAHRSAIAAVAKVTGIAK